MKKLVNLTLMAAAAIAMAGCSSEFTSKETVTFISSIEETTGINTLLTEYSWNKDYSSPSLKRTLNSITQWEDVTNVVDPKTHSITHKRDYYDAMGTLSHSNTRVALYAGGWGSLKSLIETDAANKEVEAEVYTFDYAGRVSSYVHRVGGAVVEQRSDYNYDRAVYTTYHTQTIFVDGVPTVRNIATTYADLQKTEANITKIEASINGKVVERTEHNSDGMKTFIIVDDMPVLVEEWNNVRRNDLVTKYDIIKYAAEGKNPVKTTVTVTRISKTLIVDKNGSYTITD